MKKYIAFAVAALALASCDSAAPVGAVYANTSCPVGAAGGTATRMGQSHAVSYCHLIAIGDCSVERAQANGGITHIASVDIKRENILGIVTKYVTVVKGN